MNFLLISPEDERKLSELRNTVKARLGEKRYSHTISVERTAYELASHLLPDNAYDICVAALLHDVTKEMSIDEHIDILDGAGITVTDEDMTTPGILHSFSADIYCRKNFSEYVNNDILSAIKNHTVGSNSMSVFDKIIFISDFIEETRKYEACINLRKFLLSEISKAESCEDKKRALTKACLLAIEATEKSLIAKVAPVNSRMLLTKASLLEELKR